MNNNVLHSQLDRLEREFVRLRNQTPVRIGHQSSTDECIIIIGGQLLAESNGVDYFGVKKILTELSAITVAAYDPGTCDPETGEEINAPTPDIDGWPDGLGYGARWTGGEYRRVMVLNDSRSGARNCLIGQAFTDPITSAGSAQTETIRARHKANVTLADGTSIRAWVPLLS